MSGSKHEREQEAAVGQDSRMEQALTTPPVTIHVEAPPVEKVRQEVDLLFPHRRRDGREVAQVGGGTPDITTR